MKRFVVHNRFISDREYGEFDSLKEAKEYISIQDYNTAYAMMITDRLTCKTYRR